MTYIGTRKKFNIPPYISIAFGILFIVLTLLIVFDMLVTSKYFRPLQRDEKIAAIIGGLIVIGIFGILPLWSGMSRKKESFDYTQFSIAPGVGITPEVQQIIKTTQPKETSFEGGRRGTMCYCTNPLKQSECPNNVDCFNFDQLLGDKKTLDYAASDALAKFFCAYLKDNAYDLGKQGVTLNVSPPRTEDEIETFFAGKPVSSQGSMFVGNCTQPYTARFYSYA